jgi:hypothetical protein
LVISVPRRGNPPVANAAQTGVTYNQNQPVTIPLNINIPSPLFSEFAPKSGGSLQVDINAGSGFGPGSQHSDWTTDVTLNLTFQDNVGTWNLSITWPEFDFHAEESTPTPTVAFNFVWDPIAYAFIDQ